MFAFDPKRKFTLLASFGLPLAGARATGRHAGERPEVLTVGELDDGFAGPMLLITSRERMAGATRSFNISRIIPLVKYRKPLRNVVIASLFLQLMGLVTPIFF